MLFAALDESDVNEVNVCIHAPSKCNNLTGTKDPITGTSHSQCVATTVPDTALALGTSEEYIPVDVRSH